MLCRAALVSTNVSEELITTNIKATKIGKIATTLAVASHRCTLRSVQRESVASYS
jgi:hypothetical protein